MSVGERINYKQLLDRHGHIRVPRIQRDYAQGRPTEATIREEFLAALEQALRKPPDDPSLPLNLDFVYGSVEGDTQTRFLPLDGQQRLTTLFLLHWYLAWQDDQWDTFGQMFQANGRARFAYSVRPSSTEFFDALVSYRPEARPHPDLKLAALIEDQPWYFRSWRRDPTIQSVLAMLNAINSRLASLPGLFARLIDEEHPAITFQLLDLKNFGLSDDLYIKMNARGKPLTAFETFKARYEDDLKGQFIGEVFPIGQEQVPVSDYVARRMDTAWTDLFWKRRDRKTNLYDNAIMNVFRALAVVTRAPDRLTYTDEISKLRSAFNPPSYTDFHRHEWLDERFTRALIDLLDAWSAKPESPPQLLPSQRIFNESRYFDEVTVRGAAIGYIELVQFAAYAFYISEHRDAIDPVAFQEWMRIVFNLAVNTDYNRADDFRRSVAGLHQMRAHSADLLTYFADPTSAVIGFSEPQIAEERLKAELILAQADWRALIDRAEGHGYFRGQIDFLLDFCGAVAARKEAEPKAWAQKTHEDLQAAFRHHLHIAELMFSDGGLRDVGQYRWERALLCIGDYLLPYRRNRSFLVNPPTDEASWKRLLRGAGPSASKARPFLKSLWEALTPDNPIAEQLNAIIQNAQVTTPWRNALVNCPDAFDYCHNNCLRWEHQTQNVYLLKRVQMNGAHAELFTYCLYSALKRRSGFFSRLRLDYDDPAGSYLEPGMLLTCQLGSKWLTFRVEYLAKQYHVRLNKNSSDAVPDLENRLAGIGFAHVGDSLHLASVPSEIESVLKGLDQALQAYSTETTSLA